MRPVVGDIVLFVYNDAAHCEKSCKWKLSKVLETTKNCVNMQWTQAPKSQKMVTHTTDTTPMKSTSYYPWVKEVDITPLVKDLLNTCKLSNVPNPVGCNKSPATHYFFDEIFILN